MKRRYIEPKNHKAIKEYDFYMEYIESDKFTGYVSTTRVKKVNDVWFVPRENGRKDCILAPNYRWLMFIPNEEKYAITAMYDEQNKIKEWYFDMIKSSGKENEMPYIDDLYLDLVIGKNGETYVLDENELKNALEEKDITEADYQMAHETLDMLLNRYDNGKKLDELKNLTDNYLSIGLEKLESNKK